MARRRHRPGSASGAARAVVPAVLLCLSLVSLSTGCATVAPGSNRVDSFEGERVNRAGWAVRWWNGSVGGTDPSCARGGDRSLRVTVLPGDSRMYGRSGQATERSELLQRARFRLGEPVWYAFSVYVPTDFPLVDVRLVMAQWKQSTVRYDLKRSPVVAQRFRNGRLSITIDTDAGQRELYSSGSRGAPALVGRWTDFAYRIRFAKDETGELDVWIDGEHAVSYRGVLGYRGDPGATRFRVGLYRDAMPDPMTVYYDEVSVAGDPPCGVELPSILPGLY